MSSNKYTKRSRPASPQSSSSSHSDDGIPEVPVAEAAAPPTGAEESSLHERFSTEFGGCQLHRNMTPAKINTRWDLATSTTEAAEDQLDEFLSMCVQNADAIQDAETREKMKHWLLKEGTKGHITDWKADIINVCQSNYSQLRAKFGCVTLTNDDGGLEHLASDVQGDALKQRNEIRQFFSKDRGLSLPLFIVGDSGSGKTHLATVCPRVYRRKGFFNECKSSDVLMVFLKIKATDPIFKPFVDCDSNVQHLKNQQCADNVLKNARLQRSEKMVECIRSCISGLAGIKLGSTLSSSNKGKFKAILIVLDEVMALPALTKSVFSEEGNREMTSGFNDLAEKCYVICSSTGGKNVLVNTGSTPGDYYVTLMDASTALFEQALDAKDLSDALLSNPFFRATVLNRRCAMHAVESLQSFCSKNKDFLSANSPADAAARPLSPGGARFEVPDNSFLYSPESSTSPSNSLTALAGVLAVMCVTHYVRKNVMKVFLDNDSRTSPTVIVVSAIRKMLLWNTIENVDAESLFTGLAYDPLLLGFARSTLNKYWANSQQQGTNDVATLTITASHFAMSALNYGLGGVSAALHAPQTFEAYAASFVNLLLDALRHVEGEEPASLETFVLALDPLWGAEGGKAWVKVPDHKFTHKRVSNVLYAHHAVPAETTEDLESLAAELRETEPDVEKTKQYAGLCAAIKEAKADGNESSLCFVNVDQAPYADVIGVSGDILFLVQCKRETSEALGSHTRLSAELEKMGFNAETVQSLAAVPGVASAKPNTAAESASYTFTAALMRDTGCNICVPIFAVAEGGTVDKPKEDGVVVGRGHHWDRPPVIFRMETEFSRSFLKVHGERKWRPCRYVHSKDKHNAFNVMVMDKNGSRTFVTVSDGIPIKDLPQEENEEGGQ